MNNLNKLILDLSYTFFISKFRSFPHIMSNMITEYFFGRKVLWYVEFSVDFDCNLKCKHCFAEALKNPARKRMAEEDYKRVAGECMKLGTVNFSFQGGEPLLCTDLGAFIKACNPERNIISLTTNGSLLDESRLKMLKNTGVDIITFSLDSSIESEHDEFRGSKGTFAKAKENFLSARKMGFKVAVNTVLTHNNLHSEGIKGLIDMAKKYGVFIYFLMPARAGRWTGNNEINLNREDQEYIDNLACSIPNVKTDLHANANNFGCCAVKKNIYITPYGDVLPCPFMHISMGNIFEEPIEKIRQKALKNKYFSGYNKKCLISTDEEFISRYLSKTYSARGLPLQWKDVFKGEQSEKG